MPGGAFTAICLDGIHFSASVDFKGYPRTRVRFDSSKKTTFKNSFTIVSFMFIESTEQNHFRVNSMIRENKIPYHCEVSLWLLCEFGIRL